MTLSAWGTGTHKGFLGQSHPRFWKGWADFLTVWHLAWEVAPAWDVAPA